MSKYPVTRNLPTNLQASDRNLFAHELKRFIPQSKRHIISNFVIDAQGTFITFTGVSDEIGEKSSVYNISKSKWLYLLLKKMIAAKLHVISKPAVWFTDGWSNGYFHWMLDALPRLHEATRNAGHKAIVLPRQFKGTHYVHESLKALGYNEIQFMKSGHLYFFRQLHFQTHLAPTGNYNPENIISLRKQLLQGIPKPTFSEGKRIYISRSKANRRKITNEAELIPVLKKKGFTIVHFEDYSWQEQVSICYHAEILMGLHGAGLSNMLFMQPKTKLVELRGEDDSHNNCYFSLASALNLKYYYLLLTSSKEDILDANFIAELSTFQNLLNIIIN